MRGDLAFLARDPQRMKGCTDCRRKPGKLRTGFDAGPEHARPARIREKSEAAKIYGEGSAAGNRCERVLDHFNFFRWSFTDKFQRDMQALDARPARVLASAAQFGAEGRERTSHFIRNVHRDKEAHDSGQYSLN